MTINTLYLRVRLWWRRVPTLLLLAAISLGISAVGTWLSWGTGSITQAVGPNLIADGLMIFVAAVLIDRLNEARLKRHRRARVRVIYRDLRSIYTLTLSLWGLLLFVGSKLQDENLSEEDFAEAFETRVALEPFNAASLESIRHVGAAIAAHPEKDKILRRLKRTASDVFNRLEQAQQRHDSHLEPDLFLVLEELRHSALLVWLGKGVEFDLLALGENILFSAGDKRDLMKDFGHERDDPRELDVLPLTEDRDIQVLIPLLGDHVDRIADELLTRDAYRVPRTISPASAYYG